MLCIVVDGGREVDEWVADDRDSCVWVGGCVSEDTASACC